MIRRTLPLLAVPPLLIAASPGTALEVEISGLRNQKGIIHACLTRNPANFPDCANDPAAIMRTVPSSAGKIAFQGVPPGTYALAVFHDANSNRKLDTFMGIPREGFGFSRNPKIRFGAPRFEQVNITLAPGVARTSVRLQYLL